MQLINTGLDGIPLKPGRVKYHLSLPLIKIHPENAVVFFTIDTKILACQSIDRASSILDLHANIFLPEYLRQRTVYVRTD